MVYALSTVNVYRTSKLQCLTKIFAAPAGHSGVVGADLEEELPVHPEEAAGHRRRGRWVTRLARAIVLERNPVEMPRPGNFAYLLSS